jgi:hypothetical protein
VKIGLMTIVLHSEAPINFCPHFPYFLTDFSEFRYRSPHKVAEQLQFREVGAVEAMVYVRVKTKLYLFFTFFFQLFKKIGIEDAHKNLLSNCEIHETGRNESHTP